MYIIDDVYYDFVWCKTKNQKSIDFPPLNKKELKELEELKKMDDESIDYIEIPELTDEQIMPGHFVCTNPLTLGKIK